MKARKSLERAPYIFMPYFSIFKKKSKNEVFHFQSTVFTIYQLYSFVFFASFNSFKFYNNISPTVALKKRENENKCNHYYKQEIRKTFVNHEPHIKQTEQIEQIEQTKPKQKQKQKQKGKGKGKGKANEEQGSHDNTHASSSILSEYYTQIKDINEKKEETQNKELLTTESKKEKQKKKNKKQDTDNKKKRKTKIKEKERGGKTSKTSEQKTKHTSPVIKKEKKKPSKKNDDACHDEKKKENENVNKNANENDSRKSERNERRKKKAKEYHKVKASINFMLPIPNFNREDYFKEFEKRSFQKSNFVLKQLKHIDDIKDFILKNTSLCFENIYAYNNFLYEIYDKFSDREIKKVKKIIKNYTNLIKININTKIKYAETFYKICPKEYNEVLTCLFIQSIDILKEEDVSNTFCYDKILSAKDFDGENEGEEINENEKEIRNENENDIKVGVGVGVGVESGGRDINENTSLTRDLLSNQKKTTEETNEKENQIEKAYEELGVYNREHSNKRKHTMVHKQMYEIDVKIDDVAPNKLLNEKKFVIVYDLPIIHFDLLIDALKETFAFCGNIKNIEIHDEILRTADMLVINANKQQTDKIYNVKGKNKEDNIETDIDKENNKRHTSDKRKQKDEKEKQTTQTSRKNMETDEQRRKRRKKDIKKKRVGMGLNSNVPTRLYGIIEFENEKGAELATSEYIRIFGIFCYNKLIYVDKCENKKLMVITHLPFDLNIYNILYLLLNASLFDINIFLKTKKEEVPKKAILSYVMGTEKRKASFTLKNSDIKIENKSDIFNYEELNDCDAYNFIYEVSKKSFQEFEETKEVNEQISTTQNINSNSDSINSNDSQGNGGSFLNFYQKKNIKQKQKTRLINNNTGRTLLLRFDKFSHLLDCLQKFLFVFKDKSCIKFSFNLKRCVYVNGMIQDHICVKNPVSRFVIKTSK